jgi:hypothetical protein
MIIVYEQDGIKILIPCATELSLIEIGEKDIDLNFPFWIVNYDDLPNTPQETWKLENMGDPSGYGKRK